jgi:hypothetical protein
MRGRAMDFFVCPLSQETAVFVGQFQISIGRLLIIDCACLWIRAADFTSWFKQGLQDSLYRVGRARIITLDFPEISHRRGVSWGSATVPEPCPSGEFTSAAHECRILLKSLRDVQNSKQF